MNEQDARDAVRAAIGKVAPDVGSGRGGRGRPAAAGPGTGLAGLPPGRGNDRHGTGVDIPERDYPEVATVKGLIGYLAAHG